ncbi:hypothetical protein BDZ45DRAFT_806160 [Acephala macrosclerotiorum]|nr:hypothetical protein BDZ45DRAFT_806160 [Acephala macrosclerotiorum]
MPRAMNMQVYPGKRKDWIWLLLFCPSCIASPVKLISIEKGLNEADYEAVGKHITDQGGKIIYPYEREGVAPGYQVEFPAGSVHALESHPHIVGIEGNGLMKTQ